MMPTAGALPPRGLTPRSDFAPGFAARGSDPVGGGSVPTGTEGAGGDGGCSLPFRSKVPTSAADAQRALARLDLDRPPGAVAFGIRGGVAQDVAPPQVLDDAAILLRECRGVLRKVGA